MSMRDPARTCLVTGASRGLGLEFVRQYAAEGWTVHAAARDPSKGALAALATASNGAIVTHAIDVADPSAPERLGQKLRGVVLDVLINNAGVFGPKPQGIEGVDAQGWLEAFAINTVAPVRITLALLDSLARAKGTAVTVTSRMGSIGDTTAGGYYAYRATKAGVNAAMHALALDARSRDVTAIVIHPGWVKTDMGGDAAPLTATDSVNAMRRTIAGVALADTGSFFNYDGSPLPW
jgi:NAD(P)-dependent dehydrogenase (short-subunit alcohol dehydrogenase family)